MTERAPDPQPTDRLQAFVERTLREADADAIVHAGTARDPSLRYCLAEKLGTEPDVETRAVAVTDDRILEYGPADGTHPAERLAERLREADIDAVLSPSRLPHDAALYLENAGISIASSDVFARARANKTAHERERIEYAQAAARSGLERAAATLLEATTADDRLAIDGDPLTAAGLRRAADEGVVAGGGFPIGRTSVMAGDGGASLSPGDPIAVAVAARGPRGYRGRAVGTLIVAGEGGWERRAHVAVSRALASGRAYCSSEEPTVGGAKRELEAEIRAYGFDEGVRARVHGIGLESRERPLAADAAIDPGSAVALEASVDGGEGTVSLSTLLARTEDGVDVLGAAPDSLEPSALVER